MFQLIPLLTGPAPIAVTGPGEQGELYFADQNGMIAMYDLQGQVTPFLDLSSQMPPLNPQNDQRGLLDILLSPDNLHMFAFFTSKAQSEFSGRYPNGQNVLLEIDMKTRTQTVILRILSDAGVHNGGKMAFGPDGFLYLTVGDGSPGNDSYGKSQNLSSLQGKVLRLDVKHLNGYTIPSSNPFVGYPGLRPEIYAYGVSNPTSISFSREGKGYLTDAGPVIQEINILQARANYGWNIKEGLEFTNYPQGTPGGTYLPTPPNVNQPFVDPVFVYQREEDGSIIGAGPLRDGTYVFGGDQGYIMTLSSSSYQLTSKQRLPGNQIIRSFSQDKNGTLYIMTSDSFNLRGNGTYSILKF